MSRFLKVVFCVLCAVGVFALFGCQAEQKTEPTDTELLGQVVDPVPFYALIIGNDSRVGTVEIDKEGYSDGTGRSDTMMLARIDPVSYKVALVTIPRDTACTYNGETLKINETYRLGGVEAVSEQVRLLTGVKPTYYLDMSFVQFDSFVNALGGVQAEVPINMKLQDIVSGEQVALSKGTQDLDGSKALVLARSRKQYADNLDACRQIQDRQLVEQAIKKVCADPANAAQHVQALVGNVDTNWPAADIVKLVGSFADHASSVVVESGTGPYAGGNDESTGMWLATRDEATWRKIIETIDRGGDPKTVVPLPAVSAA